MNDLAKVTELNPMTLLERAVASNVAPEQLSQLMDLQDRWEAKQAKAAFYEALGLFQQSLPEIKKTKEVKYDGKVAYHFTPLPDLIEHIKPLLLQCDLTYRWEISNESDLLNVTCVITHKLGHSERTTVPVISDKSGGKNSVQAIGSGITYGQRYSLIGALGISTADEDNDGGPPKMTVETVAKRWAEYNLLVQEHWASIDAVKRHLADENLSAAAEAYCEMGPKVNDENMRTNPRVVLFRSATRGGIWTVAETKLMRGQEWDELCLQFDQEKGDE